MRRPTGRVRLWRNGVLVCERDNLVVNAGLPAFAKLAAGSSTGEFVSVVGYGSGNTAPAVTDTGLTLTPAYYNAVGAASFPSPGTVQFAFALQATDYAAYGLNIQEIGLFANTGAAVMPAAYGFSYPAWAAGAAETVGVLIADAAGHVFRCTTAGTTGTSAPSWNTAAIGDTTPDGTAGWTYLAAAGAPQPMIAHAVVPAFAFSAAADYSGTWSLTF